MGYTPVLDPLTSTDIYFYISYYLFILEEILAELYSFLIDSITTKMPTV